MAVGRGRHIPRRVGAAVLVLLTCVFALMAVSGAWAGRNLLDTDRFVSRVGPVIEEPPVQEAVANFLTNEIMKVVDPEALFEDAFADRPAAQLLAGPLAGALRSFVNDQVLRVVSSDTFAALWESAIRRAHSQALLVLEDKSETIETEGDEVLLDLAPIIQNVLDRVGEAAPALLSGSANVEDATAPILPDEVRDRIEEVTGVTLDESFGTVVVYEGDELAFVQKALYWFERGVYLTLALMLVCAIGAFLLSTARRRTALQLVVGLAIVSVLLRRVVLKIEDEVPSAARTAEGAESVSLILDRFIQPLLDFTAGALVVLLLVALVLAVTGPYGWAQRFRGAFDDGGWVPAHRDALGPVAIGAAFVLLLFADLDWWAMAVVLAAAVGVWFAAHRGDDADETAVGPTPAA